MSKVDDNKLSYVENITLLFIIRDIISRKKTIKLYPIPKVLEQNSLKCIKQEGKVIVNIHLLALNNDFIFEQCTRLQKEIIEDIWWLIGMKVREVNLSIDKIVYNKEY